MKKVLLVIDLQNDYFPDGKFPLWNSEKILENVEKVIEKANTNNIPVVLVQHISSSSKGKPAFFENDTEGVQIHPRILKAAINSKIVVKGFADSFHNTNLDEVLTELGVEEITICGMMTQNCVNHTAISKSAEKYIVKILSDCCTTINEVINSIALSAVSTRIELIKSDDYLV